MKGIVAICILTTTGFKNLYVKKIKSFILSIYWWRHESTLSNLMREK